MSVNLKRKLVGISLLIILILSIVSIFIKVPKKVNTEVATQPEIVETQAKPFPIQIAKDGSITYEENDYFKKYTINCTGAINSLKYNDTGDKFVVELSKSQLLNININTELKIDYKALDAKDNGDSYIINFKKTFRNENFIHVDIGNKSKILIFISKTENPYKYKVVVDPGHGGNDQGTSFGKLLEKNINLKISKYMEDNLRYNGCRVIFTRETDKWVDLNARPDGANSEKADVLVSIHINSNKGTEYNGVDTYYYDPSGFEQVERMKLAKYVQNEILKNNSWKNMGVVRGNLAVLRRSTMPSILVECGFLSNPDDRAKLSEEQTLQNFGNNISNGIIKYLKEAKDSAIK